MDGAAAKRREARRQKLLQSSEDRLKRIQRLKMQSEEPDVDYGLSQRMPHDAPDNSSSGDLDAGLISSPQKGDICVPSLDVTKYGSEKKGDVDGTRQDGKATSARLCSEEHHNTEDEPVDVPSIGHTACCHAHHRDASLSRTVVKPIPPLEMATEDVARDFVPTTTVPSVWTRDSGCVGDAGSQTQSQLPSEVPQPRSDESHVSRDQRPSLQDLVCPRTIIVVILAILTRLWFVVYLEQSIIVLFSVTQCLLMYLGYEEKPHLSSPLRIAMALLTFKGVAPETVHRIQRCLGLCQTFLQDLAIFLFVVIMLHSSLAWPPTPGSTNQPTEQSVP